MGKILLVSFEGDEEELVNSVISVLDSGREKFLFQEIQLQSKIRHKGIAIDLKRREVVRDKLLAQNPGRVFSKEQIYDVVWKEAYSGDYNIVMSHISHIREKIEDDPGNPVYIQTVWGVGYKFNERAGSE